MKLKGAPLTDEETQQAVDTARSRFAETHKPKSTAHLESLEGTVNGQRATANFNPETGVYTNPDTGAPIKGFVRGVPPQNNQPPGLSATPLDIPQGSAAFKVAQDLAYGRLDYPGFIKLYSYSRDPNIRQSIYFKATELNPNFNMTDFERGLKFATNPKVVAQLASLDNVKSGVADLLKFSDQAARSGLPIVNQLTMPGGIKLGSQSYSNFKTARTAFADELSGALGYGSATDMSREMGFDMTDPTLTPETFASNVRDVLVPFVQRKENSLRNRMGVYGNAPAGSTVPPPSETRSAAGFTFTKQSDGSWTSDKGGVWELQKDGSFKRVK